MKISSAKTSWMRLLVGGLIVMASLSYALAAEGEKEEEKDAVKIANALPEGLEIIFPEGEVVNPKEVKQESYYQILFLVNTGPETLRIEGFSVEDAINLKNGAHSPVELTVNGQKASSIVLFPPKLPVKIELRAGLPTLGDWLILMNGSRLESKGDKVLEPFFYQIPVKRKASELQDKVKPTFVIDDIGTLNAGTCDAALRINLRDTSGLEHTLSLPQILLNLQGDANAKYQAHFKAVRFTDEGGASLKEVHLQAGKSMAVMVHFDSLKAPGAYAGSVIISAPGMIEVTKTFSINIRASIWYAIFLIALGTMGGHAIVWLMGKVKPRLQMGRKVAHLRDEIIRLKAEFTNLDETEALRWKNLENEANRLASELISYAPSDGADRVKILNVKINVIVAWMLNKRDVKARLEPDQITDEIQKILDDAQAYIDLPQVNANGAADVLKALQTVSKLVNDILAAAPAKGMEMFRNAGTADVKVERKKSLEYIERTLFWINLASTATICLLATLLGLKLFYFDNYSWGTCNDMVLIFLWGFGLHTVAKNTDFSGGVFSFISGKFGTGAAAPAAAPADSEGGDS